jgi:hypothetical protein
MHGKTRKPRNASFLSCGGEARLRAGNCPPSGFDWSVGVAFFCLIFTRSITNAEFPWKKDQKS